MPAIVPMFVTQCWLTGDLHRYGIVCSIATWLLLFAPLFSAPLLRAQPSDTILPNPKAVLLHRIWMVRGSVTGQDLVGAGAGAIGDIDGDSINEFAVRYGRLGQWRVYKGARPAPDTNPMWTLDSAAAAPRYPVVGDFWGTGHRALGFGVGFPSVPFDERFFFSIYRTESGTIADTPALMLDPYRTFSPPVTPGIRDIRAADLDGDGADELIVAVYRQYRGTEEVENGEVWIFKGGPNFQVGTPTVILRDPQIDNADQFFAAVGDLDGDHRADLITTGYYGPPPRTVVMRTYFGAADAPYSWRDSTRYPSRTDTLFDAYSNLDAEIRLGDVDGDHVVDLIRSRQSTGVYVFRSGSGKDARTRSYASAQADRAFVKAGYSGKDYAGVMSDAVGGTGSMLVWGPSPHVKGSVEALLFNGSRNGPDSLYDAYYAPELDGLIEGLVFGFGGPIGDCNGDGWDDYLAANPSWYGFDQGIAVVLAGGPYIPRDSATLGVRDVAVAGRADAVSIWPNPMRD